jgi:hypothetical protein
MTEWPKKRITAAELMAQLQDDPEYQQRRAALDADIMRRDEELAAAERPILAELRQIGIDVESVWDLVNRAFDYDEAIPLLIDHLRSGAYPDRVLEGLGRALAVPGVASRWGELKELYRSATGVGASEGLAVALSAFPPRERYHDLVELVRSEELGESRGLLLESIARLGGEQGLTLLRDLVDHPQLGTEAARVTRHGRRGLHLRKKLPPS